MLPLDMRLAAAGRSSNRPSCSLEKRRDFVKNAVFALYGCKNHKKIIIF
jgi:hypothetical protein